MSAPAAAPTLELLRHYATAPRVSCQALVRRCDPPKHHGGPRSLDDVTLIVMHCTAGGSAMSSIDYLNTTDEKVASYHYVIDRDGLIYRMCAPDVIAYHAGDSQWPGPALYPPGNVYHDEDGDTHHHTVNQKSIGIAWANLDDGSEALTGAQITSALWLCGLFLATTSAKVSANVRMHREVSPGRKSDPTPAVMPGDLWRQLVALYNREDEG